MGGIASIIQAAQQQIDSQRASFQQAGDLKAQARQLDYQADVSQLNSEVAKAQGQIAASDDYLNNYKAMGRQAAAQAQGGTLGSATGQSLLAESENEAAKSTRRIRLNADMQSKSLLAETYGLRAQAQGLRRQARVSVFEGWMGPFAQPVMDHMNVARGIGK